MIHTNRIVTVGEQESIIDRPIVLYRGDREVEIEFTLVGNEFTFSEEGNVIKSVNASHGQLVLNTPSGEHMFSELAECHEGKVVFVVTKEMIDEFIEMGFYSFQIRLYDSAEMKSRVTIPPVMNGFDIRNPIAAEDETNVVDQGIVDYARIFKDQSNEELPTFTWDGEYVKTEWAHHDVITENKMNKIEDALYSINANVKESDVVMLNTLDKVKKDADKYVKEHMAEVEADVEEFERNLNTGVEQFKIDTNSIVKELENALEHLEQDINEKAEHINILSLDDLVVSGDWTAAFEKAFEKHPCKVYVPAGVYNIRYIKIPNNCSLEGQGYSTIFNAIPDGDTIHSIISNSDRVNGNTNIILKNFLVKGNRITTTPPNAEGSGITFANVKNALCENVRVESPSLHCFDAMADKPYQLLNSDYNNNATYDENKRSRNIIFKNCEAYEAMDDNFTCHYADYVYFINCRAEDNYYAGDGSENRNGFEVDDGSRNVTIRDCYATKNGRGYEIKAHDHSPAPENVTVENCVADSCCIGFQVRHIGHHLAGEGSSNGKNVTISNCKCYNPVINSKYPGLNAQCMQISGYTGVYVYNFYGEGDDTIAEDRCVMGAQYKARNVIFNGITLKGFTNAAQGIYVFGGPQRADNVYISNVFIDGGTTGVNTGSQITNVTIENANITANNKSDSIGVKCLTDGVKIKNININNAQSNISVNGKVVKNDRGLNNYELWSGKASEGGTVIELNDDLTNYDYLLFRVEFAGEETRMYDFKKRSVVYIKGINMPNTLGGNVTCYEMKLSKVSNTSIQIDYNYAIDLPSGTSTENNSAFSINAILGIKL